MRGNIIEELYYSNIDPQDRGYCLGVRFMTDTFLSDKCAV